MNLACPDPGTGGMKEIPPKVCNHKLDSNVFCLNPSIYRHEKSQTFKLNLNGLGLLVLSDNWQD